MKIELPLIMRRGWKVVKAEIVDVAPHLTDWTFAVHRDITNSQLWNVSNVETGALVPRCLGKSRETAAGFAKLFLSMQTAESMERAVRGLLREART